MVKWVKFVNDMITRIWHGKTKKADADRYLSFLQEKGVQDYLNTPGNTGVRIWRTIEQDIAHFWTVSTWESRESIAAFAGEDISKAKYYPEDQDFLLEFEPTVTHMETFVIK
jgi:heme-degrading monooxygenase HmoA